MPDALLSDADIAERLVEHAGWQHQDGMLHRELEFADFAEAFAFMTRVAGEAERLDHHPDWSNSWNKVVIDVTNHSAGGITERCFELASAIDASA